MDKLQHRSNLPSSNSSTPARIVDILNSESKSVSVIKREQGEDAAAKPLEVLIAQSVALVKAGKAYDPSEYASVIPQIARLLMAEYFYFKIDDFGLCFKRGLLGKYGPLFDRLDVTILGEWCAKYAEERAIEASNAKRKQHDESKNSNVYELMNSSPVKDALKMVSDRLDAEKVEPTPKEREKADPMFEQIDREWMELRDAQGQFNAYPVCEYNGEQVDWNLYFKIRIDELKTALNSSDSAEGN
jgi:hypothetical protein